MSGEHREAGRFCPETALLDQPLVQKVTIQEIVIDPQGNIQVPWMTPAATDLVLQIWDDVCDEPFQVKRIEGNIYCG